MTQQSLDSTLEMAQRILSKDPDHYFMSRFDWFVKNFSGEVLKDYIEDLVENCLDLAMKNSMQHYVQTQLMIQQHHLEKSPAKLNKLTKPTTRWAGLPDKITFRYSCTECHDLLQSPLDVCHCPRLPYGEHDNGENLECKKTCVERFGGLKN